MAKSLAAQTVCLGEKQIKLDHSFYSLGVRLWDRQIYRKPKLQSIDQKLSFSSQHIYEWENNLKQVPCI